MIWDNFAVVYEGDDALRIALRFDSSFFLRDELCCEKDFIFFKLTFLILLFVDERRY